MDENRYPHNSETEICLLTYDGAQHLKLHGWLKRNKVPIRSENIINEEDCFGAFTVIISDDSFYDLEEENTEKSLFIDLQIIDKKGFHPPPLKDQFQNEIYFSLMIKNINVKIGKNYFKIPILTKEQN